MTNGLKQWIRCRSIQQKISLAYGIAFSATVFGSILGFAFSKQDEKTAFRGQTESMAQLVLINDFKGSVIELLVHQDELLVKTSDNSKNYADIQADFAHFAEDYRIFAQSWQLLSEVYSLDRSGDALQIAPTAYAADAVISLAAHHSAVDDYTQRMDELIQQLDSIPESGRTATLRTYLEQLDQSLLLVFLDSIARLEAALQQEHTEATALLRRATVLQIQLTIISILLSGGLGILLMNRFSRILLNPLQNITDIAQQSMQTGSDLPFPVRDGDEVGLLAQTLNLYVYKLKTSQSELLKEEQILQRQSATLAQLSQSKAITQGDLTAAFQELTNRIAELLQVERVSIWLFDSGHGAIHCAQLFQLSQRRYSSGEVLAVTDYPAYFAAIAAYPILPVNDARADARTCEFTKGYLERYGIASMLDARFDVDGQCKGVICCEQVGSQRVWSQAEQNVVRSVSNLVSLAIEANQRQQKAQQLEQALMDLQQSQFQMVQREKMAVLGQLTSGIAHEINNPVSFIYGNLPYAEQYISSLINLVNQYQAHYPNPPAALAREVEAAELDFLQDDLGKLLASMQVGSERIHRIITSMGHFSHMDETDIRDTNLHIGIDNTLMLLNTRLRAQHWRPAIAVIKDYGDLPLVPCCIGQINQVLMNLLANAIDTLEEKDRQRSPDAMAASPSTIKVQTRRMEQAHSPMPPVVVISITDNGAGMEPAVRDRLFEAFFTTKPAGKGTGLGLSISHQVVVNHGGTIDCQSTLGQGTTFTLTL
ncbi:MAG: ATP-binding protein, partial [Cyanobacteria bacterium P01_A01_bin.135]